MKHLRYFPIVALVLVGSFALAQDQSKPLGDVVRQNKPTKKAARIITDEDMPSHPQPAPAAASVAVDQPGSNTDAAAKPAEEAKDDKAKAADAEKSKDSPEVLAMKSRMKELDMDIPNLQHMLKGTEDAAVNAPDEERRAIFENAAKNHRYSLQHAINEKEELTKKIEEAKKADEAKAKADQ